MIVYVEVCDTELLREKGYVNDAFWFYTTHDASDIASLVTELADYNETSVNNIRMYIHNRKTWEDRRKMVADAVANRSSAKPLL